MKNVLFFITILGLFAPKTFAEKGSFETFTEEISSIKDKKLLLKPIKTLSDKEYDKFILGRSFFTIPWVEAPSATTARDGLGPLFNANTCISCHPNNGRGTLYNEENQFSRSLVAKLNNDKTYGNQIAINAIHGVKFEGKPDIKFEEIKVVFPDGEIQKLLKPKYQLKELQYGELDKNTVISFRIAPSLNGVGLLANISDEDILKNADEFDKDNDGISGRPNYVYSPISKKEELGRFSWKGNISNLKHQVVDAANNDLGLLTFYYPSETCTEVQKDCNNAPKPRDKFDLTEQRIEAITFYLKNRVTFSSKIDEQNRGYELFKQVGCVKCHIDSFSTKLGTKIAPFTDMLLHDMGEDLADGKVEFKASGNEWKTPALWGLSLHEKINGVRVRLLHDGRARTFQEAILWHGGEALKVKENYMNLDKKSRIELLKFLEEV